MEEKEFWKKYCEDIKIMSKWIYKITQDMVEISKALKSKRDDYATSLKRLHNVACSLRKMGDVIDKYIEKSKKDAVNNISKLF